MNENYNMEAANWWATKIKDSEECDSIQGLELFTALLSAKIKKLNSFNGSLVISTYNSSSLLLNELAFLSGLSANIPLGYEMKILINDVFVYNSSGVLVSYF